MTILEHFDSFQKGEEKGFAYFYHLHYRSLFYFADNLLKNEAVAEDIVAESFTKFFEKRTTIQCAGTIKSFLYTTVRNACLDKIRQQKSRASHHTEIAYLQENIEKSAAEYLIRTETLSQILQAVEALPVASRNVFKLYFFEEKSTEEIAQELNRSKVTVRKQKQYSLDFLRKKLSGLHFFLLFFLLL